jgi:hypothetical protein
MLKTAIVALLALAWIMPVKAQYALDDEDEPAQTEEELRAMGAFPGTDEHKLRGEGLRRLDERQRESARKSDAHL